MQPRKVAETKIAILMSRNKNKSQSEHADFNMKACYASICEMYRYRVVKKANRPSTPQGIFKIEIGEMMARN